VFPRDMVCLRNIRVDTLHKGDTEDNNNNNNNNNNYYYYYYYLKNWKKDVNCEHSVIKMDRIIRFKKDV
jgi:hypothetical protein